MDPALTLRGFVLGFTIAAAVGPISLLVIRRTLARGAAVRSRVGSRGGDRGCDVRGDRRVRAGRHHRHPGQRADRPRAGRRGLPAVARLADDPVRRRPRRRPSSSGRRGYAGAYLSILGLTLANPMTILSFGALFAGLGVTSGASARCGPRRPRRPARLDDLVDRPDDDRRDAPDARHAALDPPHQRRVRRRHRCLRDRRHHGIRGHRRPAWLTPTKRSAGTFRRSGAVRPDK